MQPDISTMALMSATAAFTTGIGILWLSWGNEVDGLKAWGGGLFLHGIALVLLALRDRIPDLLSIVVGNALMSASIALPLVAVCQFQRRRVNWWLTLGPIALTAICFVPLLDNLDARVVTGGLIWAFQSILVAFVALRRHDARPGRGHLLLALGFAILALMFLARAIAIGIGWSELSALSSATLIHTASFATSLATLLLCSLGFVGMMKDRADERNRRLAMQDELTGGANRRALLEMLDRSHAAARRGRSPLCLLMIDLDHFKNVNDVYGHQAGDVVLRRIAGVIRARLRGQDTLGRYGGEEFMVILPDTTSAGGEAIARELCERVRSTAIRVDGASICVTLSIGVHGVDLVANETVDDMIRIADTAMYLAKDGGRDRVSVAQVDTERRPGPGSDEAVANPA